MRSLFIACCFMYLGNHAIAQQSQAVLDYINTYKQLAIEEMQRTGVPASIKLAQGIHETEAGRSELVLKSNNHFGIKCKTGWSGDKVYHDDDADGECFRKYTSPVDSYRDHSDFLKAGQRYAFLFALDPTDYKGWAYGLKKAGYATNIKYSQILVKLIETYDLQQYTLIALGKIPASGDLAGGKVPAIKNEAVLVAPVMNYPDGVFHINDTRVVFVKGGTSLLSVANQYNLSLARLLDFNDMASGEGDILNEDQLIYLQRKRRTGANLFHHVQPEESLYDIAQSEGIRYEAILELNQLKPGMEPAVGERIFLKDKSPARPMLAGAGIAPESLAQSQPVPVQVNNVPSTRHIVQQKETLYGIGKKYGVSPEKIKEWNQLTSSSLKTGQELVIYTN